MSFAEWLNPRGKNKPDFREVSAVAKYVLQYWFLKDPEVEIEHKHPDGRASCPCSGL